MHAIGHAEIVPKTSRLCREALTISQLVHLGNVYSQLLFMPLILWQKKENNKLSFWAHTKIKRIKHIELAVHMYLHVKICVRYFFFLFILIFFGVCIILHWAFCFVDLWYAWVYYIFIYIFEVVLSDFSTCIRYLSDPQMHAN